MSLAVAADVASQEHCRFCFETLINHLNGTTLPAAAFADAECALFVTWEKSNWSGNYQLRGCIGTLEPKNLHTALRDYALTSALRDHRFSPITTREVPQLSCGVSLLSSFEKAKDWQDWEIGVHGLIIEFTAPESRSRRSATFLPEIAAEQQWTKQQTIDSLIRKAGYDGSATPALRATLKVTRYQSTKARLAYQQYVDLGKFTPTNTYQVDAPAYATAYVPA